MRWLTNFYDFRFKWTATAAIGIHPTKAWLSHVVNFKNAIWHIRRTICNKFCFKLEKNATETYGMLQTAFGASCMNWASVFEWNKRFMGGRSLWGIMRGVGGVRKSIHQSWLAKGLGLGLLCWGLRDFRKRFRRKRPALFKSGQSHFHQDNTPFHISTLVTDYLSKMGIKTVPQPPYSPDLAPSDFRLFPKLKGCRYETIEKMKEAAMKVIDKLTQEDYHGAFQKLLD